MCLNQKEKTRNVESDVDYHVIACEKCKEQVLRKGRICFEKEMFENCWIVGLSKQGQLGSCKFLMIKSCKAPNN